MTLPLRYPRLWVTLAWVFVALALAASLAPGGAPGMNLLNDKVEHMGGYLLLALWFAGIYPRSRYWLIAAGLFCMGVVVELLQGGMHWGRHRDIYDVYANTAGIALGLALAWSALGGWMLRVENWLTRNERRN